MTDQELYDAAVAAMAKNISDDIDRMIVEEVMAEKQQADIAAELEKHHAVDGMSEIMKLAEVAVDWAERSGIMNNELIKAEREAQLNELQAEIDAIDTPTDAYDRAMTIFDDEENS